MRLKEERQSNQYTKKFGFEPTKFEIVNDVQLSEEPEDASQREVAEANAELSDRKSISAAKEFWASVDK